MIHLSLVERPLTDPGCYLLVQTVQGFCRLNSCCVIGMSSLPDLAQAMSFLNGCVLSDGVGCVMAGSSTMKPNPWTFSTEVTLRSTKDY